MALPVLMPLALPWGARLVLELARRGDIIGSAVALTLAVLARLGAAFFLWFYCGIGKAGAVAAIPYPGHYP
jgi:hypothetical protein